MKSTYKVVDLFGREETRFIENKKTKPNLFHEYDQFLDKYEEKKTTDDCYTPDEVYQVIISYVSGIVDLTDMEIIRPFFPGGDFEAIDYSDRSVVIDNPPFSIVSRIARFYVSKNIPFFVFAPHLTLFSSDLDCTYIVCGANIIYENGATVKTSFLSNMFGGVKVIGDHALYDRLELINEENKVPMPKYQYPGNVLTVSMVSFMVERGVSISIDKGDVKHCRGLAHQKQHGKAIFGSGFLLSEKAAAEKAAAEKVNVFVWELSESEKKAIQSLG